MKSFKPILLFLLAVWVLFQMSTCTTAECDSNRVVTVQTIKNTSSELNRTAIVVNGLVTTTLSTPVLKIYRIQDENGGAIWVKVTHESFVPSKGDFLEICAEVRELFNVNGSVKSMVLVELNRSEQEEPYEDTEMEYHVFTYEHPD